MSKTIPLTRIQKLIGKRMLESKRSKPCFYVEVQADITEFMSLRSRLRKAHGVKVTTNAFYIYCLARAVREYPLTVGIMEGENIKIADSVNVGFAIQAPQGLVVPVIKDSHQKSLAQIAEEVQRLTEKARDNELTLNEIEGETIALSNLGAYDIDSFIGIVPPPATVILAVGNIVATLVPRNGEAVVRKMVALTLAADHRIIDGKYAGCFLSFIRELIENPQQV